MLETLSDKIRKESPYGWNFSNDGKTIQVEHIKEHLKEFIYWLNETSLDGQECCSTKTKAKEIFGERLIQ